MTFDELVTKVRNMAQAVDASNGDFLAVQVNITGKALEFANLLKK